MQYILIRKKKKLPMYAEILIGRLEAKFMNTTWNSYGEMAKVICNFLQKMREKSIAENDRLFDRLKYTVKEDRIIIHNQNGKYSLLELSLAEAPKL